MAYLTFHLRAAADSGAWLPLFPGAKFQEQQSLARTHAVTLGGGLATYAVGGAPYQWQVPLTQVDSATRAQLMAWWRGQSELVFTFNLSSSPFTAPVVIANQLEPLGQSPAGRGDLFQGGLLLQETQGVGKLPGAPLVLGDSNLGLLGGPGVML